MTAPSTDRLVGIIGGSGLYQLDGLANPRWRNVPTPFGDPSDELLFGSLDGQSIVFLPRHGRGHRLSPTEINFRANIAALKSVGVTDVVSLSAVGSLREDLVPGTFVIVDQFIDRTFARSKTFFGEGLVGHVSMAQPVCGRLGDQIEKAAGEAAIATFRGGTYVVIEGPQFSSLAESKLHRSWGCDVVGMTNMPEAKLAREAELCYGAVAMVTDFDCWHPTEAHVTAADVVTTLNQNAEGARRLIKGLLPLLKSLPNDCVHGCDRALEAAILTSPASRPVKASAKVGAIAGRFLQGADQGPPIASSLDRIRHLITTVPDFPKKGVQFRDVTTLLKDGPGFRSAIQALASHYRAGQFEKVVGVEARGFIVGGALANQLGIGFVPVRKKGKLPGETIGQSYALEYGTDNLELRTDAIESGDRALIVDDLIATGGTAEAAIHLVRRLGGTVSDACFLIELPTLGGRRRLEGLGASVFSLCSFDGD